MGNKHTYSIRLGQDIYDIPERDVKSFIKDNPKAEVMNTTPVRLGNDIYDIPDDELDDFFKDNPQATTAVNFKPFKPIETKDFYKTTERESTISGYEQKVTEQQNQQRRADEALAKMKMNYMQKHNATEEETEQQFSSIENAKQGYMQSGYNTAKESPYLATYGAGGLDLISGVLGDFELLGEMVGLKDHSKLSLAEKMQSFGAGVSMDTSEDWEKGSYLKAGFKSMLRSAPMTAMALTGHASGVKGLGFATMAVPSTGNKFIDLKRNYDLSLAEKASNAILTGGAEGFSEELGTFANFDELGKSISKMVGTIGKQQTKAKLILDFTKKLALGGIEEGAEEWANTYAEAIIDQAISGKPMDMENTLKNANMAFVMGGLSGMMMTPAFAGIGQTGKIGKTEVIPGIYMSKKAFNENPDKAKEIAIAFKGGKQIIKNDENDALIQSMFLDEDALDARDLARKNDENVLSNSYSVIEKAMDIEKWFDNGIYQDSPRNAIKAIDEVINSEKEYINEEALEFLQNTKEKIKADVKSDIKNGYGRIDKMNDYETALFNKTTETLKTLKSTLKDSNEAPQELAQRAKEIISEYESLYQNTPLRLRNIELRIEIEHFLFWASFIKNDQNQEGQTQDDSQIIESDIDTAVQEEPRAPKPEDKPFDISSKIQNAIDETKPYFEQEKDEKVQEKLSLIESALKEFESSEDTPENNQKILDEINDWNLSAMFKDLSENNQKLLGDRISSLFNSVSERMNRNADAVKTIEDKNKNLDNSENTDIIQTNDEGGANGRGQNNTDRRTTTGIASDRKEVSGEPETDRGIRGERLAETAPQKRSSTDKTGRVTGTGEQSEDVRKIEKQVGLNKKTVRGKKVVSFDSENNKINTVYVIYELDDLVNSHDTSFNKREDFVSPFQNRDLSTPNSKQFIIVNAQNFNANRVINNYPDISNGSPVVTAGGIVLGGNTRTFMLKYAKENKFKTATESYQQTLEEHAETFGISKGDLEQFDFPVLVREITDDTSIDQLKKIARDTNIQSNRVLSIEEQAIDDAKQISDEMMNLFNPTENGDILANQNDKFVKAFLFDIISDSQRNEYTSENGEYTQALEQRIQNAIWIKVFGDNEDSIALFKKMAVDTESDIKGIVKALVNSCKTIVKFRKNNIDGLVDKLDITDTIISAINKAYQEKQESGLSKLSSAINDILYQIKAFGNTIELSDLERLILKGVDENYKYASTMTKFIKGYYLKAIELQDERTQTSIEEPIPLERITPENILKNTLREEEKKQEDKIEEPEQTQQKETSSQQEPVLAQSKEEIIPDTDNNDDDKDSEFTSDELLYINRYAVKLSSRTGKPREHFLEMGKKLVRDIKNKDFEALESRLHSGNPESIKLFNEITGNNAKTQKQVKTALSKMEGYEEYDKQRKKEIDEQNKQAVEKALQKKAEEVLNEIVSYHGKRMTNKEFIDTIISEGFTQIITREQGISTVYRLENKKGVEGFTFRKKAEKDYIDSVMADLDSKAEQEQIKNNPDSVASDEDMDHLFGEDDTQQPQPETIEVIDDYTLDDEGNIVINEDKPIVKPEVKAKEEPEITNYGASNKLVSTSRADEIRRKLRDKLNNQLNSGFDPEIFTLSIELAVYHIEAGVRKFIPFVKKMISDVGNGVRPYLKSSYNGAKNFPNMTKEIVSEMDSYEYVDSFDLDKILLDDSENKSTIESDNNKEDQNGKDLSGGTSNSGGAGNRHQSDNRSRRKTNEVGKQSKSGTGNSVPNGSRSNGQSSDNDNGENGLSGSMDSVEGHKATGIPVPSGATQLRGKQVLPGDSDYFNVGVNLDLRDKEPVHLTKGQRRKINEQALKILDKPLNEITDEDKEILRQYTGMGGLSENAGELGYLNQHYTDYPVIKAIFTALEKSGFKFKKALEPAVGVGNFIGMSPEADWDAVDIDETNAKIAQILYPQATVYNTPFQKFIKKGYDLIISNVPFLEKLKGEAMALHDLYFVKSINQVKDNGLVVFITSKGTMDKVDDSIRLELMNKADLVGAYRLPSGTFEKNANTSVITDIIVLQKRPEGAIPTESQKRINDQFLKSTEHPEHGLKINEYYVENPEHILGTLEVGKNKLYGGGESLNVTGEANLDNINIKYQAYEIKPEINETHDNQNKKIEWEREKYIQALEATGIVYDLSADRPDYKIVNGVFHLYDGTKTDFTDVSEPVHYYHTVTADTQNKLTLLFELQKIANEFQETGLEPDMNEVSELIDKYKNIAKNKLPATDKAFKKELKEVPYLYEDLSTLFKDDFELADIFTVKTQHKNSGKITLNDNSSLLDKAKLYQDGQGIIKTSDERFTKEDIEYLISTGDYCLVDKETIQNQIDYYSGNIRAKIKDAQENIEYSDNQNDKDIYERQIQKLNEKMPPRVTIENITIKGTEHWISELFRENYFNIKESVSNDKKVFVLGWEWYKILGANGKLYVENYINNKKLFNTSYTVDKETIVYTEEQQELMKREADLAIDKYLKYIKNTIMANPELTELIEKLYNENSNFYVAPDYGVLSQNLQPFIDELPKTKDGKPFGLRKNQIEWVSRALYEGKGINAHDVGGGKTYAGIFLAHIMKAKGMANKPMFVVPSKVIYKWKRDIEFMYPKAKIIVVNLSGNDKADKIRTLAKIKKENADYILITHEGFKSIEVTPDTIDEGYNEIEKEIFTLDTNSAREQSKLKASLDLFKNKLKDRPNSFGGIYFEDLGVDCVIADEAHAYKNTPVPSAFKEFGTQLEFSGKKDSEGNIEAGNIKSFQAIDFRIKARYIQKMNNDRNIFLLTATPTPNKILEIYNMLTLIGKNTLEEYSISNISDFFNMFFNVDQIVNEEDVKKVKTFIGSIKSYQLFKQITRRFIDFIPTHKMPWIELPTALVYRHSIEQDERDKQLQTELRERFKNAVGFRKKGETKEDTELKIEVFNQIRQSGIDPILYDQIEDMDFENEMNELVSAFYMNKNPKTSKIAHCVDLVTQTHKDNKEAGQLIFLDLAGHSSAGLPFGKNLHRYIKEQLIEKGFKATEIGIISGQEITGADGKEKSLSGEKLNLRKDEIVTEYNEGKWKVLIGSTQAMGEGMDIQKTTTDIYHLDIPYRPAEYQQRNGRGIRFGNKNSKVNIHYYVKQGSLDNLMLDIVSKKEQFNTAFNEDTTEDIVTLSDSGNSIMPSKFEIKLTLANSDQEKSLITLEHQKHIIFKKLSYAMGNMQSLSNDIEMYKNNIHKSQYHIENSKRSLENNESEIERIKKQIENHEGYLKKYKELKDEKNIALQESLIESGKQSIKILRAGNTKFKKMISDHEKAIEYSQNSLKSDTELLEQTKADHQVLLLVAKDFLEKYSIGYDAEKKIGENYKNEIRTDIPYEEVKNLKFKKNSDLQLEHDNTIATIELSDKLKRFQQEFFEQTKRKAEFTEVTEALTMPKFAKANRIAKAFGLDGVIVFDSNIRGLDGAVYDNTIYISKDNMNPVDEILKHELVHHIRIKSESSYQALAVILKDSPSFKRFVSRHKERLLNLGYDESIVDEELLADFIAEKVNNKHFWQMIANKDAGLFDRIKSAVQYYWNLLRRKLQVINDKNIAYRVSMREIFRLESEINKIQSELLRDRKRVERYLAKYKLDNSATVDIHYSKSFKEWFGDWENDPKSASKVVDDSGKPLVVYHGTDNEFDEFVYNPGKNYVRDFEGFYFSDNINVSESYSESKYVIKAYLNIKNPIIVNMDNNNINGFARIDSKYLINMSDDFSNIESNGKPLDEVSIKYETGFDGIEFDGYDFYVKGLDSVSKLAKKYNYDGVFALNIEDTGRYKSEDIISNVFVAFNPNQIKSADQNNGDFSKYNNNIKFKLSDEVQAKGKSVESLQEMISRLEEMRDNLYKTHKRQTKALKDKFERQYRSAERETLDMDPEIEELIKGFAKVHDIESWEEFTKLSTPDGRLSTVLSFKEAESMAKKELEIDGDIRELGQDGYSFAIQAIRLKLKSNAFYKLAIESAKTLRDKKDDLSNNDKSKLEKATAFYLEQGDAFNIQYSLAKSNAGRILRYAREAKETGNDEVSKLTAERAKQQVKEFVDKMTGAEEDTGKDGGLHSGSSSKDILDMLSNPDKPVTPEDLANRTPSIYQYILMSFYTGLLSSPATHGRNIINTALNVGGLEPIINMISDLVTHHKTTGFAGLGKGFIEGIHRAGQIITGKDNNQNTGLSKFGSIDEYYQFADSQKIQKAIYKTLTITTKALQAEDAVSYSMAFENSMTHIALELSSNKKYVRTMFGEALSQEEAYKKLVEKPTQDMIKKAVEYALERTYNKAVPDGVMGIFVNAIEEFRKRFEGHSSFGKFVGYLSRVILPFTRVVANVTNSMIDYTPVASSFRANMKNKDVRRRTAHESAKYDGKILQAVAFGKEDIAKELLLSKMTMELLNNREIRLQISKSMTGYILVAMLFCLLGDLISGGGAPDKEKNSQMRATGWQEYSIKIGDKWVSYKNIPGLNLILSLIGNIHDSIEYKKFKAGELTRRIGYATLGTFNTILDQSFLSGLSDVITMLAFRNDKDLIELLSSAVTIPIPTAWNAMKYIHDIFDPRIKKPEGLAEIFLNENRILGQDSETPFRINTFGQVAEKQSPKTDILGTIGKFTGVGVGYVSIKDPELELITKTVLQAGMKLPASNGRVSVKFRGENIDLNGQQTEKFLIYRGEKFSKKLKAKRNLIMKLSERIQNGEAFQKERLERILQKMHQESSDYAKRRVKRDLF